MSSLSLVSLNVERNKRLGTALPFLGAQKPDVACLQEVCGADVVAFADAAQATDSIYVPTTRQHELNGEVNEHGLCILSHLPMLKKEAKYYVGDSSLVPDSEEGDPKTWVSGNSRVLMLCSVEIAGVSYRIANTHFTWSPEGRATEEQQRDIRAMLALLEAETEFVLCGDFNAPRGGEIFGMLAERYKDNIPPHYKTSLDMELHRAAKAKPEEIGTKMVDGLFTTPGYVAHDVELVGGLSDHLAIVAKINKK